MAARPKEDVVTKEQGSPGGGGSKIRYKQKCNHHNHAFKWETLNDPSVQAEMGWKIE
jgi:hypothetical protein